MRSLLAAATIAFAAFLVGPAPVLAADDARPALKLQSPADEVPRPTDEALRSAMTMLRDTVGARLQGAAAQPMAEAEYVALAQAVQP